MKKVTIGLLLTLFSVSVVFGQEEKAKAILDALSEKTKNYKTIKADFSYVLENKVDDLHIEQQGSIQTKGKKFKLVLEENEIYCDGETQWTYSSEGNEVYIDFAPESEGEDLEELNPTQIFTVWESGFKYKYITEKSLDGKAVHVIHLFPKEPAEKSYHTVVLTIDKQALTLKEVQIMSKEGDLFTYRVQSFSPNVNLSDDLFVFKKARHPGVEEIDNR